MILDRDLVNEYDDNTEDVSGPKVDRVKLQVHIAKGEADKKQVELYRLEGI